MTGGSILAVVGWFYTIVERLIDALRAMRSSQPGCVRHIWCILPPGNVDHLRNLILRIYWDGQPYPSVEVPLGDFFGIAHGRQQPMLAELIAMQVGKGFNCWIPMPFRSHVRITVAPDSDVCYVERSDDYASVAYWCQGLPGQPFPALPDRAARTRDLSG